MRTRYVDVTEAATLVGKSEMTIRRLMKEPGSKPHVKQDGGKAVISETYLYSRYPAITLEPAGDIQDKQEQQGSNTSHKSESDVNPMLVDVIRAKDDMIKVLREDVESKERIISTLLERGREQNIIIQSLQDNLKALPAREVQENMGEAKPEKGYTRMEKGFVAVILPVILITLSILIYLIFQLV